jgi:hypothetical protein
MAIEVPTEDLDRIANIIRMKSFGETLCWEGRALKQLLPPQGKFYYRLAATLLRQTLSSVRTINANVTYRR